MTAISLVADPAVESDFIAFEAQEPEKEKALFAIENEEERKILGVAIRADKPIYRRDPDGFEYYVVFDRQSINDIILKFSKSGNFNAVTLQHREGNIEGVYMTQMFIKNSAVGISPSGFEDIEEGSLFVEYKVEDDELWHRIKNSGFLNGFSIELYSTLEPTGKTVEVEEEEDEFLAMLREVFGDDVEGIFEAEKKKFAKVTRGDVREAIAANRKCDITVGRVEYPGVQPYQIGRQGNVDVAIVYDPASASWYRWEVRDIASIIITDAELENFAFGLSYKQIADDSDLVINETKAGLGGGDGGDNIRTAIDYGYYAMISYDDQQEDAATGFRNCAVTSWGYTIAGNECIRVYEYSGDSRRGFGEGRWRFMLTRRIMDFKLARYAGQITIAPPLYNGERQRGSGKNGTMSHVIMTASYPPASMPEA